MELDENKYIDLLRKLISESKFLQNQPPKYIPQEDKAGDHVLEALKPFTKENGGPLEVQRFAYQPNRGHIIIKYPSASSSDKTVSFVGSHLDVVPADPVDWKVPPFELTVEDLEDGDKKLYGRGTTDCLGHVALITNFFIELATKKPALNRTVAAVFIASEESNAIPDVGVEMLNKDGKIDFLKNGPCYWVDSADSQPCMGTAGVNQWSLKAVGKLFHSGLPHKAINPIEFATESLKIIQDRFYKDFAAHPRESEYKFATPSTMKPTQITCAEGSLNQIPPHCTIQGDIRITPFHDMHTVMKAIEGYVADINEKLNEVPCRGPVSKYELPQENLKGRLELTWLSEPHAGIACSIDSEGFRTLTEATKEVIGECVPYSIGGSLPLVKDLQDSGFDIQMVGYGKSSVYHGNNEYCLLSDMKNAFRIFDKIITKLN